MTFELNKQASFYWTNITIFMRQDIKSRHVRSKSFTWPNPQHQHEGLHCCCSHCLLCGRQVKNAIITRLLICHTNLFCIWWSKHTMKLQYMRNTRLQKKTVLKSPGPGLSNAHQTEILWRKKTPRPYVHCICLNPDDLYF